MSLEYLPLKKESKIHYQRFNSAKISHKLVSKITSPSGFSSSNSKISTRNKTKILITNVLSASKHYIINGNDKESTNDFIENIQYKYPYKPNFFLKINSNDDKISLLSSKKKQNNVSSFESSISTFKSMSNSAIKKNMIFFPNSIFNKKSETKLISNGNKNDAIKITKRTLTNENKKINLLDESEINLKESIIMTNKSFLKYIDDINSDKNYLNIYKNYLSEYFNLNSEKNNQYYFKKILSEYKYEENEAEKENYFSSNFHSVKTNNFLIKDSNIIFKISSLKIIFYEISENKETFKVNTKLKFPFEFLSVFYGLNFSDFINLLIALIEFNFTKNKFYINYNTFITKIEDAKILYDFFKEKSFANNININNVKEYYLFDWDVKMKNNEIKHFKMKVLLPQIKLKIICSQKIKIKFNSYINIKTIDNLLKNSFINWDFFIFVYFSQHRLFRYEINKIICNKYSTLPEYKNLSFNLTNSLIKINTLRKTYTSYCFFYSLKSEGKNETYFINFKIPKIIISFHALKKNFEFDFRRFHQFSKLTKYILPEDLIKYSISIKKLKIRKKFESKKKLITPTKPLRPFRRDSERTSVDMSGRKGNIKKFFKNKIKERNEMNILNPSENNDYNEIIKDIDLNLDKYIFNFDESIFKFIKTKEEYKDKNIFLNKESNEIQINNDNSKKLNVDIGTLELSWTNRDGFSNIYKLDEIKSQKLFSSSQDKWKEYVEKNINKIISGVSNSRRSKTQKRFSFFPKM